jgi:archaellum biogenesis protein FlaJ (TadC family)
MTSWLKTFIEEHTLLVSLAAGLSLVVLLAGMVIVPLILIRMRSDYFVRERRTKGPLSSRMPVLLPLILAIRNILGAFLVLMGLIMLFTPGQGLITILVGLMMMNFPGKYRLERWFITRRRIHRSVNWLRNRAGKPPIKLPQPP